MLPLYATGTLGLTAAEYSRVLSLRMMGVMTGTIVLGAVSDRLGTRRVTLFCLLAAGLGFSVICLAPMWGFLILVPLVSAMLSASFVNLNQLTQMVGSGRQGLSNTLYRATGTGAGMIGPLLVTYWIGHVAWVVLAMGVGLCIGAWCLKGYPIQERVSQMSTVKHELKAIVGVYKEGLTHGRMMAFVLLSLGVYSVGSSVDAFGAVRLTQELGAPAWAYGNVLSIGSGMTLFVILLLGAVLDRWPLKACLVGLLGLSVASLFCLGVCQSVFWTQVFLISCAVGMGAALAPAMMWLSRVAGKVSLGGAFAMQKVMNAIFFGVAMLVMSVVVPVIGIQWLFICCAMAGVLLLGCLMWLEEPGRQG